MVAEDTETLWLDAHHVISFIELVELSGLPETKLRELIEEDVVAPVNPETTDMHFRTECISIVRAAQRLSVELDLDTHGLSLVLTLLQRVRSLEAELQAARTVLRSNYP
ncbi:MAG: chaperone modulator CbpM [Pseudomonadota bacterium]